MILYKKLPSKFTTLIQQSMLNQIDRIGYKTIVNHLHNDREWYLQNIKGLAEFLDEYKLKNQFRGAWLSGVDAGTSFEAHVDKTSTWQRNLAVNIPIQGTKQTAMNWYHEATFSRLLDHHRYGIQCHWTNLKSKYPSLELLEPHMVRTDIPHNIENNSDTQRIVISLKFNPDPSDQWPELFIPFVLPDLDKLIVGQIYKFE